MGKLTIKNKSVQVNAEYNDDNLRIDVTYNQDGDSKEVINISGSVYGENDTYVGNFNGMKNGSDGLQYSFHGFSDLAKIGAVAEALTDIEKQIAKD